MAQALSALNSYSRTERIYSSRFGDYAFRKAFSYPLGDLKIIYKIGSKTVKADIKIGFAGFLRGKSCNNADIVGF